MTNSDAAEILSGLANYTAAGHTFSDVKQAIELAIEALNSKRPNGKWVPDEYMRNFVHCSHCGNIAYKDAEVLFTYCPACGAFMKGDIKWTHLT